jgi:hypothetical protein
MLGSRCLAVSFRHQRSCWPGASCPWARESVASACRCRARGRREGAASAGRCAPSPRTSGPPSRSAAAGTSGTRRRSPGSFLRRKMRENLLMPAGQSTREIRRMPARPQMRARWIPRTRERLRTPVKRRMRARTLRMGEGRRGEANRLMQASCSTRANPLMRALPILQMPGRSSRMQAPRTQARLNRTPGRPIPCRSTEGCHLHRRRPPTLGNRRSPGTRAWFPTVSSRAGPVTRF